MTRERALHISEGGTTSVPRVVLATYVASRWTSHLDAAGLEQPSAWGLTLGSGSVPESAPLVARRVLELSQDQSTTRLALDALESALIDAVGPPSQDSLWWRWLGELHATVNMAVGGAADLRLAMAFDAGELQGDRGVSPVQRVGDALVETARRALRCDACEFVIGAGADADRLEVTDGYRFDLRAEVHGGGVAGTLVVARASRSFDRQERAFLHALAAEAGFALDAFALADHARNQAESLGLLYQVSCQLQVDLDLESVLGAVCEAVCTIVGAERAVILELRPDGSLARVGSYRMEVAVEPELGQRGLATSLAKRALSETGPVVVGVDDLAAEVGQAVLERLGVRRSLGCVPLRAAGEPVGLVFFDHSGRRFTLDQAQRENCQTVGNLAALAIERVRLHHAAKETARLQERERIARELHDSVAQQLFRVGLELRRVAERDAGVGGEIETSRRLLADASAHLRQALHDDLPVGRRAHLTDEVRAQCAAFTVRTGIACTCTVDLPVEPPEPLAALVCRFAGEALTNVEKYADAHRVSVDIRQGDMALVAVVADDGRGPTEADGGSSGISSLQREASSWGGDVTLARRPTGGAELALSLPWVARRG
ncbi:MAG TPA: GAF domain-containing protein [Acidimicrobiales bacterium]|nr:GAF domain-containing protein [Acidimicrobiales bacterium]